MEITKLAQLINQFDWGCEMSDSYSVADKGDVAKKLVIKHISELSENNIDLLYTKLNDMGHKNMERYFKGYLPKLELLSNCCGVSARGGEDYGICPRCGEHCEFTNEQE